MINVLFEEELNIKSRSAESTGVRKRAVEEMFEPGNVSKNNFFTCKKNYKL